MFVFYSLEKSFDHKLLNIKKNSDRAIATDRYVSVRQIKTADHQRCSINLYILSSFFIVTVFSAIVAEIAPIAAIRSHAL